jgi:hypothetical protein
METSLRFDSQSKHLKLFAKEKFSNDDNYVLTVRAAAAPSNTSLTPFSLHPQSSLREKKSFVVRLAFVVAFPEAAWRQRLVPITTRDLLLMSSLLLPLSLLSSTTTATITTAGLRVVGHQGWAGGEQSVRAQKVLPRGREAVQVASSYWNH